MNHCGARVFYKPCASMRLLVLFASIVSMLSAPVVLAKDAIKAIASINHYSPLEAAYSHGANGFSFGLGYTANPVKQNVAINELSSHLPEASLAGPLMTAYLVKGFDAPIDVGITASQISGSRFERIGAHAQWTVFEGFRMPSLALRGSYSRMSRAFQADSANVNISALADVSFLRYFTAYLGVGESFHRFKIHTFGGQKAVDSTLSLIETAQKGIEWQERSMFYGFAVKLIPPFVTATVETQSYGQGENRLVAKISLGM